MVMFKSPEKKAEVLDWTKQLFIMLGVFEPLRGLNKFIDDALTHALWPQSSFVREGIIGSYECDFTDFAPMTINALVDAARGFGSKPIEDLHRCLNTASRQNVNGKLSRNSRWHTAWTCGVIEGNDRKGPRVSDETRRKAAGEALNNRMYDVRDSEFSMGADIHKDLLSTKEIHL
jgi:hypothetical protein